MSKEDPSSRQGSTEHVLGSRMASQISSEYCFEYDVGGDGSEASEGGFHDAPVDTHAQLKDDLHKARAYLSGLPGISITERLIGDLMWVTISFRLEKVIGGVTARAWGVEVSEPITIRLELSASEYTETQLPPKIEITQLSHKFLLGQQLVNVVAQYLRRSWSLKKGFQPSAAACTLHAAKQAGVPCPVFEAGKGHLHLNSEHAFAYDVDPRCVEPYVPDEGGLITHVVRYILLRIRTASDFCVLCDQPHLFAVHMVRPAICSRATCVFAFHEMGVGSDAADTVAADSDVVELLTVMFLAAANSLRAENVLNPFPSLPDTHKKTLALDPSQPNYDRVRQIASAFPSLGELRNTANYEDLRAAVHRRNPLAFPLLGWVVASNRSYIVKVPPAQSIASMQTTDQFLLLTSTPEKENAFRRKAQGRGTFLAFHGSRGENWHSILREGLKNYSGTKNQLNGAAHGSGIYFGKDSATSMGYSMAGGVGFDVPSTVNGASPNANDINWKSLICLCLCEVVKGAEKDHGWCWTVEDEESVMTRLFFVYRHAHSASVQCADPEFVKSVTAVITHFGAASF